MILKVNSLSSALTYALRKGGRFKKTRNPIFMITVPKGVPLQDIATKARYLQRTRVYFEQHINKKVMTQCKKWQEWGHATSNCFLNIVRRVKCAQSHRSYECPDTTKESSAKCCNCGGAHPASSTECPRYMQALESRQRRQQPLRQVANNKQTLLVLYRRLHHMLIHGISSNSHHCLRGR
ncbi:hypothetical protein QE152_g27410 [Popillia japonica]|uniref:Uncharacterized protein n=1 Tax=Popillia japonica TaxID=7064 RepID=A0AAW1JT03_POPJA